ncbi:MAG: NAD-dependent epimerase/dehydratase family protein [Anaerolineae bacterium]|nr:NAD-dependent epimerase/dehydratase family protein [Anaerolineae bacterium]
MKNDDAAGKKSIVVTGISGYFGRVLLPLLEQDGTIEQVIGIDRRPPFTRLSEKVRFYLRDVQDPGVEELLRGADVLVHLAFVLMRLPGVRAEEIEKRNVRDAQAVFEAAARQGVRKIVFTSSVVAYGLHPDNPIPLTEDSPLRPNEGLYYGRAKAAIERYLDQFEREHPDIVVTRLRPCTVVGPRADPAQMASLVSPTAVLVRGANPLYQLVHEDDVASALHFVIQKDLPGAYNVAGDHPLTLRELAEMRNGRVLALPYFVVRTLMGALWRMGRSPFAPEWTDLLRYPLVVSNEKLKRVGWVPRYTTAEALQALLAASKGGIG